ELGTDADGPWEAGGMSSDVAWRVLSNPWPQKRTKSARNERPRASRGRRRALNRGGRVSVRERGGEAGCPGSRAGQGRTGQGNFLPWGTSSSAGVGLGSLPGGTATRSCGRSDCGTIVERGAGQTRRATRFSQEIPDAIVSVSIRRAKEQTGGRKKI